MKTTYRIRQPYADIFQKCADEFINISPVKPECFIQKMKENTGMAGAMFGSVDENGLERRNPVIVALGDSVTAGHFESILDSESAKKMESLFSRIAAGENPEVIKEKIEEMGGLPPVEIYDTRESYIEKFRNMLIDYFELTSVSVINAGVAGEHLPSMIARSDRDIIRHDPDLVLINGSLNWNDTQNGDSNVYKSLLKGLVQKIKKETTADIILLTPNGDLPNTILSGRKPPELTTALRAEKIREVAQEEQVCLADVRAVWDNAAKAGCPWEELLANKVNHPSVEGHEVYAKVLMKLIKD